MLLSSASLESNNLGRGRLYSERKNDPSDNPLLQVIMKTGRGKLYIFRIGLPVKHARIMHKGCMFGLLKIGREMSVNLARQITCVFGFPARRWKNGSPQS